MSANGRTDWTRLRDLEEATSFGPNCDEWERERERFFKPLRIVFLDQVFRLWAKRAKDLCGDPRHLRVIELMEWAFMDGARAALNWDKSAEWASETQQTEWYRRRKSEWDAAIQQKRDRLDFLEAFEKAWKKEQKRKKKGVAE